MIDSVDIKILDALIRDSKQTYADIGKLVNLKPPTVFERIKRLEKMEIIKGYGIHLNPDFYKGRVTAFVKVGTLATVEIKQYTDFLVSISEVVDCFDIAGEENLLLRVEADSPEDLSRVIRQVRSIPGTTKASTVLVLSKIFEKQPNVEQIASRVLQNN